MLLKDLAFANWLNRVSYSNTECKHIASVASAEVRIYLSEPSPTGAVCLTTTPFITAQALC